MKIAVFFHCLVFLGPSLKFAPSAVEIIREQMDALERTGLLASADHFEVGVNGGSESLVAVSMLIPNKAKITFHGLDSRNENSTIRLIEQWLPGHPGWYVLYFHSKGATWPYDDPLRAPWKRCMMRHCVLNWRRCVLDLKSGFDAAGCHWFIPPITPSPQRIFAGNFFWAKSDYLATLPSITQRARIKMSGLKSHDSRYESEVWIGNGPRIPKVMDYHPGWRLYSPH